MTPLYRGHLALLFAPLGALGASSVAPTSVELLHSRQVATIQVSNPGPQLMRIQASATKLSPTRDGVEREPTNELVVVPALAELRPGARQVFRVALRRSEPSLIERNYRLLLQEVAVAAQEAGVSARLTIAHDLPVSILPAAATEHRVTWSVCAPAATPPGRATAGCLLLHNQGNRRIRIASLTLRSGNEARTTALTPDVLLLPNEASAIAIAVAWPGGLLGRSAAVTLTSGVIIEAVARAQP